METPLTLAPRRFPLSAFQFPMPIIRHVISPTP